MREKINPLVKVVLDSGKVITTRLQDAIDAGLIVEDVQHIRDKARYPYHTKERKREDRR